VFVDQSYWQCAVAAKPSQGVWGFLAGGLVWFGVPFVFASTMGLAYLALSANAGAPLLTDDQVNRGTVHRYLLMIRLTAVWCTATY